MHKTNFTYNELNSALSNRIDIHKNFSNFNLHQWIKTNCKIENNQSILDMGCGNGNFVEFFLSYNNNIKIVAVDKNLALLNEIKKKFDNLRLINSDFDEVKIENQKFDWIFFIYSIYYSQKPRELIAKMYSYLKNEGQLVIIGPGKDNATELDNLNLKITGLNPKPEYRIRQQRIENEFYELSKEIFGNSNCRLEILDNKLIFPSEIEYANYYWSTLLWRDSLERINNPNEKKLKKQSLIEIKNSNNFVINKQVSTLIVKK
jgi:ubiquinone/menaquinone biosynthesis C-methylase UbiE